MKIADYVNDKRILIWGYGREGKSMERFLKEKASAKTLTVFEGKQEDINEQAYDLIIKSPGIVPVHYNERYTSMTELFLKEFAGQTIGITGTKGKSTTASLLYHVLSRELPQKALMMGNMGLPCLDYYDKIDENTVIVFEMSCHQLQFLTLSPHVAVFLNLFPEHLDHYGTMEAYTQAKMNITRWQEEKDHLFVGEQLGGLETKASKTVILNETPDEFDLLLKGVHNQFNARVVYTICTQLFDCDRESVKRQMSSFSGLRHRLEFAGTIEGVDYYDDSISTIPEASIEAVKSIPNAKTLLIGGMDRGIPYDVLVDFIRDHPEFHYVLMYDSGRRIFNALSGVPSCKYCSDLESAVAEAKRITKAGEACILSPAAASYGYFSNFEERGDVFQKLIRA